MNTINLFERLGSVTHFSINAKAESQWQGAGQGVVKIHKPDQQTVIWEEKGQWDSVLKNIEFSNSYRWVRVHHNEIRLEHLRYGEHQSVELVNIHYQQDDTWVSFEPHQCGQDSYQLDVTIEEKWLTLDWKIIGPKKNQFSTIRYG